MRGRAKPGRSTATVCAQETETKIRERANWAAIRAPANGWRGKAIPVPARLPTATVCARETETKIRERGNRLLSQSASLHRPTGARKPGPFGSLPFFRLCFALQAVPEEESRFLYRHGFPSSPAAWSAYAGLALLSPSLPFSVSPRAVAFSAHTLLPASWSAKAGLFGSPLYSPSLFHPEQWLSQRARGKAQGRQPFTEPITCVLFHSLLMTSLAALLLLFICGSRSSRHLLASTTLFCQIARIQIRQFDSSKKN